MRRLPIMVFAAWLCVTASAAAQTAPAPSAPAQTTPAQTAPAQQATPAQAPPAQRAAPAAQVWGALAFTADGSYSSVWKSPTKAEAEAHVAKGCAKFGRGACEVISFGGQLCAALATYVGTHSGRRFRLSFTGGGATSPDAQKSAMSRCNDDKRTRGRCQLRTVVCGDGR